MDLGPLPPRNQVTLELEISPDADIGPVDFRLQTPLGTSPEARFLIEPYYGESPDREPNDTPEEAFETYSADHPGGHHFQAGRCGLLQDQRQGRRAAGVSEWRGHAGLGAAAGGGHLRRRPEPGEGVRRGRRPRDAHRSRTASTKPAPTISGSRIIEEGGSARHFYRIKVGKFPLALAAYPLGVEKGKTEQVTLSGYNLGAGKVAVKGVPSPEDEQAVILRPKIGDGQDLQSS